MNILIADDEMGMRYDLKFAVERAAPSDDNVFFFAQDYDTAVEQIKSNKINVAFLDINMPGKTGLELARTIKSFDSNINIIMVTAHREYALDALRLYVSAYLLKPVDDNELREALANLRTPVDHTQTDSKKLDVKCFGNFEVFIDEKAVRFTRQKGKELFAYLVCLRGTSATRGEICTNLFEGSDDKKNLEHLKKAVQSLKKDLSKYGLEEVLHHRRNAYSVDTNLIKCDYYDYLERKPEAQNLYRGEFLNQYSWAETYIYHLENYIQKLP
ncbi:MAG: response regulator [Ruminococcus sp.]|nr:response regulator [Ruminococcus sp.]